MMALLRAELSRALSRRFVRALVATAVGVIAVAGVLAFLHTEKFDAAAIERARTHLVADTARCRTELSEQQCSIEVRLENYDRSLYVTDLWPQDGKDPILMVAIVFLAFGGLVAAASVVGADWRSGMLGTLLTWEPRRVRVAVMRVTAAALAAAVIAILVQLLVIVALLPSMLLHGGTAGVDGEWVRGLLLGMSKGAVLVGLAAAVGASLALIGRNTAVAIGVAFVYLNLVEGIVRAWRPNLGIWLVGENATTFLMGRRPDVTASRSPTLVLVGYAFGLLVIAAALFRRRDITT